MYWTHFIATLVCYSLLNGGNGVKTQGPPPTDPPPSFNDTANWQAAFAMFNDSATSRSGDKNLTVFDRIFKANALARGKGAARSDNVFLFEADIHLTQAQLQELVKSEKSRTKRAVIKKTSRNLWRKNQIAYTFASSISSNVRRKIKAAVAEWQATLSCMGTWTDQTYLGGKSRDYMQFFKGGGCYSMVGRQGGLQRISIGNGCDNHGTVVHEIGHAMGLWHEQSRPDRDRYVTIVWGNIRRGMEYNFRKKTSQHVDSLGVPYDYTSVMHYGSYAFSNRYGAKTIVARNNPNQRLGQYRGLSNSDKKQARLLYGCDSTTTTTKPTPKPTGCTDVSSHRTWCAESKKLGICTNAQFKSYMKSYCCASCKPCVDKNVKCAIWKTYCSTRQYKQFMDKNCCKTCSGSPSQLCVDTDKRCSGWRSFCTSNSHVKTHCKKTCGLCT